VLIGIVFNSIHYSACVNATWTLTVDNNVTTYQPFVQMQATVGPFTKAGVYPVNVTYSNALGSVSNATVNVCVVNVHDYK
jgi:hypothetical protein